MPQARTYAWPAYAFLRSELASLALLILPVIGLIVLVGVLAARGGTAMRLLATVFAFLVFAQYARVVYRGLLDGRRPSPLDLLVLDRMTIEMAWTSVITSMATALPILPFVMALGVLGMSTGGDTPSTGAMLPVLILGFAGMAGVAYVGARLVFALVLVAAGVPGNRLAGAWRLSHGIVWLIVKIGALTVLPLGLAAELIGWFGRDEETGLLGNALIQAVAGTFNLATVAVAAHALVALYRDLTSSPAPPAVAARAA